MSRKLSMTIFLIDIIIMVIFIFSRWKITIMLNGGDTISVPYGHEYMDPGATAKIEGKDIDIFDGEVPVKMKGSVDTNALGSYTVKYRASRLFYSEEAERTVNVVIDDPPVIVLNDVNTLLDAGDVWTDSYEVYDNQDGDITSQVVVSGSVDQTRIGSYELNYSVTDSAGNTATASRTVRVVGVSQPVTGSKIVFLTFDDGPWDSTDELLDILARHDAKATFFVTGNHPENFDCIGREFAEGHTVAVHTYTHNFDSVYQSTDAYWADFDRANDLIAEQTGGYRASIFRFPGGSSNTISSFNPGVMTRLAEQAAEKGYEYYDWNVDCGDGGGLNDTAQLYQNIISGIQSHDISVVLCHDTHSATVAAIDDVLTWGEENGYVFLSLGKGVFECHHGIAN